MLIDHLVYAARDLDAAVAEIAGRTGVRAVSGGRHIGLGTRNALLGLGPRTYLEIIAADPGQPSPPRPRPFGIDGLTRDCLAGWALACEDIEVAAAAARRAGYDPGEVASMRRATPAGAVLRWRLTGSALAGGPVPFLICWDGTAHPAASAPPGLVLESFHLEHPDPGSLAVPLAALGVGTSVRRAALPALVATVRGPSGTVTLR